MENCIEIKTTDTEIMKGLKLSINHMVEKLKKGWKPSIFAQSFPTLAEHHEATLEKIRTKVLESLSLALYSDLTDVVEEELGEHLKVLNQLIKASSTPHHIKAWRPTGNPHEDILTHDVKNLQYEKGKLMEALDNQKKKRQKAFQEVKRGRRMCDENHVMIEEKMNDLRSTANMCTESTAAQVPTLLEH